MYTSEQIHCFIVLTYFQIDYRQHKMLKDRTKYIKTSCDAALTALTTMK